LRTGARAVRTNLPAGARLPAGAAVRGIAREVDAGARAIDEAGCAGRCADAVRADLAGLASVAALSAVERIRRRVDALPAAGERAGRACRSIGEDLPSIRSGRGVGPVAAAVTGGRRRWSVRSGRGIGRRDSTVRGRGCIGGRPIRVRQWQVEGRPAATAKHEDDEREETARREKARESKARRGGERLPRDHDETPGPTGPS
jgi:hypothetical protein